MSDEKLDLTARHEAGHVVAAWYVGQIVSGVSIKRGTYVDSLRRKLEIITDRLGTTDAGALYHPFFTQISSANSANKEHVRLMHPGARRDLIVLVAGGIAGAGCPRTRGMEFKLDAGAENDLQHARKVARLLPWGEENELYAALEYTRNILHRYWSLVEAIADALLHKQQLNGQEIEAVITQATGGGWRGHYCKLTQPLYYKFGVWQLNN